MEKYTPSQKEIKKAEKIMTTEQEEMSNKRETSEEVKHLFFESDLYKKEIEPFFNKDTTLTEKIIFLARCEVTSFSGSDLSVVYYLENSSEYKEFIDKIRVQFELEIKTPEELDAFMRNLVSILGEINYGKSLDKSIKSLGVNTGAQWFDPFNAIVSQLQRTILKDIFTKHYDKYVDFSRYPQSFEGKISDEDMEWMYTLAKYLYATNYVGSKISEIYLKNIDNPKSVELKKFYVSKGIEKFLPVLNP